GRFPHQQNRLERHFSDIGRRGVAGRVFADRQVERVARRRQRKFKTSGAARTIMKAFSVNGRTYRLPDHPIAVICVDGCGDEYLSTSIAHGRMPHLAKMSAAGYRGMVRGALPSFTNVNNCAMVTGTPPKVTGIGGNYIIDPETGEE